MYLRCGTGTSILILQHYPQNCDSYLALFPLGSLTWGPKHDINQNCLLLPTTPEIFDNIQAKMRNLYSYKYNINRLVSVVTQFSMHLFGKMEMKDICTDISTPNLFGFLKETDLFYKI